MQMKIFGSKFDLTFSKPVHMLCQIFGTDWEITRQVMSWPGWGGLGRFNKMKHFFFHKPYRKSQLFPTCHLVWKSHMTVERNSIPRDRSASLAIFKQTLSISISHSPHPFPPNASYSTATPSNPAAFPCFTFLKTFSISFLVIFRSVFSKTITVIPGLLAFSAHISPFALSNPSNHCFQMS